METIYFCDDCKKLFIIEDGENTTCSQCGKEMISLDTSPEEWNELTNEQMLDKISIAKSRQQKKSYFKTA